MNHDLQLDETSTALQSKNILSDLQYFPSALLSILSHQRISNWISMGFSLDLLHDRLRKHEPCEASLLLILSQRN